MSEKLPDPLVPAEIDLRDYREFPLEFERVFDSDTWTLWNDRERVVGLRLWAKPWHQEPCASLPTDDRLLAKLAGYGDAVKEWQKVKKAVLSGWILCSDGRLYHHVVAEKAIDKWRTKRKKQADNAADAERKRRKRLELSGGQTTDVHPENGAVEVKRREEETASLRSAVPREPRRKPRKAFPADWLPDEQDHDFALSHGRDEAWIAGEAARCRDHHIGRGNVFADLHAAWRTWVMNAEKFEGNRNGKPSSTPQFRNGFAEIIDQAERASAARVGGQSPPIVE